MANHLIQPIDIDGATYCHDQLAGRMTRGVNTALESNPTDLMDVTDLDSPWIGTVVGLASEFEVSFGIGCGSTINFTFSKSGGAATTWTADLIIYVDGVAEPTQSISDAIGNSVAFATTATSAACGKIITARIDAFDDDEFGLEISLEVTSIT
jgi:hypothetical protein